MWHASRKADAALTMQSNVDTLELSTENSDGSVSELYIETSGNADWNGFPNRVEYAVIEVAVQTNNQGPVRTLAEVEDEDAPSVKSTTVEYDWEGIGGDVFENTEIQPSVFAAEEDGSTNETVLTVSTTLTVSDGTVQASDNVLHEVTVSVTDTPDNDNGNGNGNGSGNGNDDNGGNGNGGDTPEPFVGASVEIDGRVE